MLTELPEPAPRLRDLPRGPAMCGLGVCCVLRGPSRALIPHLGGIADRNKATRTYIVIIARGQAGFLSAQDTFNSHDDTLVQAVNVGSWIFGSCWVADGRLSLSTDVF